MTIEHLLTRPVSALPVGATCAEAARRMQRQNIGSLVIEDEGTPIGILTDRDLALRIVAEERDPAKVLVGSVMSKFPAFLTAHRTLDEALDAMREKMQRRGVQGQGPRAVCSVERAERKACARSPEPAGAARLRAQGTGRASTMAQSTAAKSGTRPP